jgi:hypothetical protein
MPSEEERDREREKQTRQRLDVSAGEATNQAAVGATHKKLQERKQNPEFLDRLRDLGLDTSDFPRMSSRLGPAGADSHLIGNRSEEYEREIKWLDQNRAERVVAERESGRLCNGRRLAIAQRVHQRDDKSVQGQLTIDEKRAIRNAFQAVTDYKSLAIGAKGIDALTTATTVTKRETNEEQSGATGRLSGFLGGR